MSNVPSSRRRESRFEAEHNFYQLRDTVTQLMINDFGFSPEKYHKQMERYRASHASCPNVDEVVQRWEKKCEAFNAWFIDKECDAVLDILRKGHVKTPEKEHCRAVPKSFRREEP